MKIIDPHLHLFALELGHYHWLKAENPPFWPDKQHIYKSFDETDLMLTAPYSLAGFIHIEAGFDNEQPWRELAALEQSCNKPFRAIANIDLTSSSTRRDDLLLDAKSVQRMWVLRKYLADMNPIEAMEFINDKVKYSLNNDEFLISMNG